MTILIATGLRREARIMAGPGVVAIPGGGDVVRLEAALEALIAPPLQEHQVNSAPHCSGHAGGMADLMLGWGGGYPPAPRSLRRAPTPSPSPEGEGGYPPYPPPISAILSSGLAGALDPSLRPGDVVIGAEGDARIRLALHAMLPKAVVGSVVGSGTAIATIAAKRALHRDTGAIAVDMESHIAARVAARHGLPFATLRVISDAADHALPPAALAGMRPDGGMGVGAVLVALLRQPGQLPALIRTARDAERGFSALLRCYRVLGVMDVVQHALDMA